MTGSGLDLWQLDTALRGAGIVLQLLLILHFLASRQTGLQLFGGLFSGGIIAWLLVSPPGDIPGPALLTLVLAWWAILNNLLARWLVLQLLNDRLHWDWRDLVLTLLVGCGLLLVIPGNTLDWLRYPYYAGVLLAFGDILFQALRGLSGDLVPERRWFRIALALVIGIFGLTTAGFELLGPQGPQPLLVALLQSASVTFMSLLFAFWLTRAANQMLQPVNANSPIGDQTETIPPQLAAQLPRLEQAMKNGIWQQEGLSVADLAADVGLPEHQLRRLINQGLGFRNFSAYLNSYRIAAACGILRDPDQAQKQILQIALDVGYGSIGPFNRAFKEQTALTPRQWRDQELAKVIAN